MITPQSIDHALRARFDTVANLGNGLLRGERLHQGKPYVVAYFDLSDSITNRARDLRSFQEKTLGVDFFASDDQLRWNNYVYFVAGPNSENSEGFDEAKARIESNRDYARKFVVSAAELIELLSESSLFSGHQVIETGDVTDKWKAILSSNDLSYLLDKPARTKAFEWIAEGKPGSGATPSVAVPLSVEDAELSRSNLSSLKITFARGVHDGRTFRFGNVNLIEGPNGSGKTTLLEAIEFLYCGCNRRGNVAGDFDIDAVIRTNEDRIVRVRPPLLPSQTRARNLTWYRKESPQSRAILSGFTRFNFLDTDAAYRLSADLSAAALDEDLTRLSTGSEAATLWDYLVKKLMPELGERIATAREALNAEITRRDFLRKELLRLERTPSESSALLKTYRSLLRQLGWQGLPDSDDAPLQESERMSIEEASRLVSTIRSPIPNGLDGDHSLFTSIPHQLREFKFGIEPPLGSTLELISRLTELVQRAQAHEKRRLGFAAELKRRQKELEVLSESRSELTSLEEYFSSGFVDCDQKLRIAKSRTASVRQALGPLSSSAVPDVPAELYSANLKQALEEMTLRLAAADANHERIRWELQREETLQDARTTWLQQLQSVTRHLLDGTGDPAPCPVCGTQHQLEELLAKVNALTERDLPDRLATPRERLEIAAELQTELQKTISGLKILTETSQRLGVDSETTSVSSIRQYLLSEHVTLRSALADLEAAESAMQDLETQGFSASEYQELLSVLSTKFPSIDLSSDHIVADLRASYSYDEHLLEAQVSDVAKSVVESETALTQLSTEAFGDADPGATVDTIAQLISTQFEDTKIRLQAAARLGAILRPPMSLSLAELAAQIDQVMAIFDRSLYATQFARSASTARIQQTLEHENSEQEVKKRQEQYDRLLHAHGVLRRLEVEHSLEEATRATLVRIREQINDVFGRIHAPREYEFVGAPARLLQTRRGQHARSLDQISTGQRSAFALSIFLSLASSATSGPSALLIDDPVAHVDDLNALSLIDYLREIALKRQRQIFFATADTRFAALIKKKFEFLGAANFTQIKLASRRP